MRNTMTIVLGAICVVALTASADAAEKKPKQSCAEACSMRVGGMTASGKYQKCMDACNTNRSR